MLPTLEFSQTQQNWLALLGVVLGLPPLFVKTGLVLQWTIRQLGSRGKQLDRRWKHRTLREAKKTAEDNRLYAANLWKRLFLAISLLGGALMLNSAFSGNEIERAQHFLHFAIGVVVYGTGLEGGAWALTYAQPEITIRMLRQRLIAIQRERHRRQ